MKNISKDISEASKEIKTIMQKNLALIADDIIYKIMVKYRKVTASKELDVIKDVSPSGLTTYKKELLEALAVISADSITQARKEVPAAKKVELEEKLDSILLGEFEDLPASLRKKLNARASLLIDTQLADLEKAIYFQYSSSVGAPTTEQMLQADMADKAYAYIEGTSIEAGAGVTGANTVNEARNAFFFEDDVLEEIAAFQFLNGDPVSLICQSLNGIIFSVDDPNAFAYTPPLHYNCKSYIVPILKLGKNQKIEKFIPRAIEGKSSADIAKSLQFCEAVKSCANLHHDCNLF